MAMIDREMLWRQFGAAIDMLGDAMRDCPDELWEETLWEDNPPGFAAFWYLAYHTLFWLDSDLVGRGDGFAPPEPFDLAEMDPAGLLPSRTYTREELLGYLDYCRRKCRETIFALTDESARRLCRLNWGELPFAELLLYSLRHVQEHGAQLRLFLGQRARQSAKWVARARE